MNSRLIDQPVATVPSRRREALYRLFLIVGSIIFFWALVELPALLNIVDYEGLEFSQVWGSLRFIRVPDPELLHLQRPYAHYVGSSRGGDFETRFQVPASDQSLYSWDLRYDHNGFRNNTDLRNADLVVIGDSMVEGMTVPDDRITTSLLAHLEGKTVANLGQYGYGPQQELVVLKRFGLPLHPKTVVWMFFEGNDLRDEAEYRDSHLHPPGFWNFFLQRSFTRFAVRSIGRMFAQAPPPGIRQSGVFSPSNGTSQNIYFSTASHALGKDELNAIGETAGMIASAGSLAASQGGRLVFVFIPDKFRVLHDFCRFPAESECRNWVVSDLPERMRNAVESASPGIGYVDLTPDLIAAAKEGNLPYYRDDIHFSEEGHRVAAGAIHRYLSSGAGK